VETKEREEATERWAMEEADDGEVERAQSTGDDGMKLELKKFEERWRREYDDEPVR
jgi:hypothetical protein